MEMNIKNIVQIIIRGIYDQTMNCITYDLHCLDPPSLTSGMLDFYGIKSFSSKNSFWKNIDIFIGRYNNSIIYRGRFGEFKIVLDHSIDEIFRIENTNIYVDALDCESLNCKPVPRSHILRVYLEGRYSNRIILKINIVTLLRMAINENPYFGKCLEEFIQNPFEVKNILHIASCSMLVLSKHRSIYDILFNRTPKNIAEILRHSPLLRKVNIDVKSD
ncbi:hypothetical protein Igag_1813 [Ignisphaera aggregans DSM 17230]|uniref:Uncharacterized protein n=1 Tax=Ignisphaera aggregans (strain DSM 17230 / JCM 13409 / AQ1.S1) TaxID=583356 RepID=E0SSM5_IGNAA|nr:hypothetical protein Igag_1813 [Ignisphaera aggregans DSM 17230]